MLGPRPLPIAAQPGSTWASAGSYGVTCSGIGGVFAIGVRTGSGALRSCRGPRGSFSGPKGTESEFHPGVAVPLPTGLRVGSAGEAPGAPGKSRGMVGDW